jgi:hypothetical protein
VVTFPIQNDSAQKNVESVQSAVDCVKFIA